MCLRLSFFTWKLSFKPPPKANTTNPEVDAVCILFRNIFDVHMDVSSFIFSWHIMVLVFDCEMHSEAKFANESRLPYSLACTASPPSMWSVVAWLRFFPCNCARVHCVYASALERLRNSMNLGDKKCMCT